MSQKNDGILLPYQEKWLADNSQIKVWEKSRRIGASYCEAANSVYFAAKEKSKGGTNTYYLSYNKEMTQQFIKDCAFWAKHFNAVVGAIEEVIIKDEDKDILTYKIKFESGNEIWGLPSKPHSLRSKQGRVIIDEAAFCEELPQLLKAAFALMMWGGSVSILSTHGGDDNPFNDLIKEIHEGKKDYSLHRVTIDDALADGLYQRICSVREIEWTQEKQDAWLSQLVKDYGEGADEELYCIPSASGEKYFKRAQIDLCKDSSIPVFRFSAKDEFAFGRESVRQKQIIDWFTELDYVFKDIKNPVYFGEDFARSGDLTMFWVIEALPNGDDKTVCVVELRNIPFKQQWQFIQLLVDDGIGDNFYGASFDARGNGQMIAEYAGEEWRGMVNEVMLSLKFYAENFPHLKTAIEEQSFSVPDDTDIKNDFGVVKLKNGIPVIAERTGDAGAKRHGDGAIAALLAKHARRNDDGGYQPMTYEAVGTPNRYRANREDIWNDF